MKIIEEKTYYLHLTESEIRCLKLLTDRFLNQLPSDPELQDFYYKLKDLAKSIKLEGDEK